MAISLGVVLLLETFQTVTTSGGKAQEAVLRAQADTADTQALAQEAVAVGHRAASQEAVQAVTQAVLQEEIQALRIPQFGSITTAMRRGTQQGGKYALKLTKTSRMRYSTTS